MPSDPLPGPTDLVDETAGLRALARRLVHHADADDLVQDTLLTALAEPTPPRSLRPWLRQVLRNARRAEARSEIRRRRRESTAALHPTAHQSLQGVLEEAQSARAIREVMNDLDAPYRAVLHARYFEGRSSAEIARALGCSASTVRWRLQEGLRRARKRLEARYGSRERWVGALVAWTGSTPPSPNIITAPPSGSPALVPWMAIVVSCAALVVAATRSVADGGVASDDARSAAAALDPGSSTSASLEIGTTARRVVASSHDGRWPTSRLGDAPPPGGELPMEPSELPWPRGAVSACSEDVLETDGSGMTPMLLSLTDDHVVDDVEIFGATAPPLALTCLADRIIGTEVPTADSGSAFSVSLMNGDIQFETDPDLLAESSIEPGLVEAIRARDLPRRGNASAEMTIVQCNDYACPTCASTAQALDELYAYAEGDISLVWVHAPPEGNDDATRAAMGAVAAARQSDFWGYHQALLDHPDVRSSEELVALAGDVGLDERRFAADLADPATALEVESQRALCREYGAARAPTFFFGSSTQLRASPPAFVSEPDR